MLDLLNLRNRFREIYSKLGLPIFQNQSDLLVGQVCRH